MTLDTVGHAYSLKILFGPLCGLELPLHPGRHFFVTASADVSTGLLAQSVFADEPDCYLVPASADAADCPALPNFAIVLGDEEHRGNALIEIYSHPGSDTPSPAAGVTSCATHVVREGQVADFDGLRVAWRHAGAPWPERSTTAPIDLRPHGDVMMDRSAQAFHHLRDRPIDPDLASCATASAAYSAAKSATSTRRRLRGSHRLFAASSICVAAALVAAGLQFNVAGAYPAPFPGQQAIVEALRGAPHVASVRQGRDGRTYVVVESQRDAIWTRQALRQFAGSDRIDVRIERDETARVEAVLERSAISFYTVRFDNPRHATLVLVGDAGTGNTQVPEPVRNAVMEALPYIDELAIERFPVTYVDAKARTGLEALDVQYERVVQGTNRTFQIAATVDDAQLGAIGEFSQSFARDWGRNHVRFVLTSPTDRMRLPSYRFGPRGYVSSGKDSIEFVAPVS